MGPVGTNNKRLYLTGTLTTKEDPRLGHLSSSWQIFYHGGRVEMDGDSNFNSWWFSEAVYWETCWNDPRLTKERLIEKEVVMEDFITM